MSKWKPGKLGVVADVKLSNVDKKINSGERIVRLCNYTDVYKNQFIDNRKATEFMIASCNEAEFQKFILRKGQVAITKDSEKRDDIGISTFIAESFDDVVLGYHLSLITPNSEELDGQFLNYWFNTPQAKKYFENNVGGSGQRFTLPLDIIKGISIDLPDISTQRRIAAVLSALDDKIELNNRINAGLEQMAKTLYDYWFVQFDFPFDFAQGRPDAKGKPYKSSGGKMVYNETLKREVPEGWEVKSIGDLCFINPEQISSNTNWDFYNYLDTSNLTKNMIANVVRIEKKEDLPSRARRIVKANDIVYSTVRPNQEHYGILKRTHENMIVSTGFTVLSPKRIDGMNDILYYFISAKTTTDYLQNIAQNSVSAYPSINPDELSSMKFVLPKEMNTLKPIINLFGSINQKTCLNQQQNQQLSSLRDWLLPMLMNGQVTFDELRTGKAYEQVEQQMGMAAEDGAAYTKKKGGDE